MKIVLGAVVEAVSSRVDGTASIKLGTQEVTGQQFGEVFDMRGKYVKVLLSDTNISSIQEQLIDSEVLPDGKQVKSRSQKLRAVLFILHQKTQPSTDFETYYAEIMDGLISEYKNQIP